LNVDRDIFTPDARCHGALYVRYGQSVARRLGPVHFDVHIKSLRDTFGENRADSRQPRQKALDLLAHLLNVIEVGALDLQAHRRFDPC
jgi:hypothetical protein